MTDTAPVFTEADIPVSADLACETCGKPLVYSGRGRKPKFCDEHRAGRSSAPRSATGAKSSNDAVRAAENIDRLYTMLAMALMGFGALEAASDLTSSQEAVKKQNIDFLTADPVLAKKILKLSQGTGRTGFIAANAMLLVPVAVTASREIGERIAAARAARESEDESVDV